VPRRCWCCYAEEVLVLLTVACIIGHYGLKCPPSIVRVISPIAPGLVGPLSLYAAQTALVHYLG
jgi:hypothetical protein